MEYRHFPRMRVSLEIEVFRREKLVGHLTTADISLRGMLLQTQSTILHPQEMVVLHLWMRGTEHVLRGIVVHASNSSAGVMLIDLNRATWLAFFNFLRDLEVPLKTALGSFTKEQQSQMMHG